MTSVPAPTSTGQAAPTALPDDLVPVITRHLEDAGEYRVVLDPREAQRLVDVRWAALGAGRILGRRVQVVTTRAIEAREAPISVLVRFDDRVRPAVPRQRED
ncbi:MAG TPA: hypothetical protein VHO29_00560 [Marmoricola sp.]|nr:hypothetical protein [Marmoricola sp.]